jgi:hypothetical protein
MGDGAPTVKVPYITPFGPREEMDRQVYKFKEYHSVITNFPTTRNEVKTSSLEA